MHRIEPATSWQTFVPLGAALRSVAFAWVVGAPRRQPTTRH
jgi:hypothetical protein